MRAYIAFSLAEGAHEGAILVTHFNARQAKIMAWNSGQCLNVDEWTDLAIRWIKDRSIFAIVDGYEPQVIWNPIGCESCGYWGAGVTNDNLCCHCNEYPGDELISRIEKWRTENSWVARSA